MHRESTFNFDRRLALICNCSLHMLRREDDVRIFWAFQNFLMHLLVAPVVSALTAGVVYNQFPRCSSGGIVKLNAAALQTEVAMDRVQRGINREIDLGLSRIERKDLLLCLRD